MTDYELYTKIKKDIRLRAKNSYGKKVVFICETKELMNTLLELTECYKDYRNWFGKYSECIIEIDYSCTRTDFHYGSLGWFVKRKYEIINFKNYLEKYGLN